MRAPENLYRSGPGVDQRIERTDAAPSACLAVRPAWGDAPPLWTLSLTLTRFAGHGVGTTITR